MSWPELDLFNLPLQSRQPAKGKQEDAVTLVTCQADGVRVEGRHGSSGRSPRLAGACSSHKGCQWPRRGPRWWPVNGPHPRVDDAI